MGDSAPQNLRRPNLTYTASAPDDGRSWRRPNSRCQGRWPAWLRCVGDIRAPSSKPCFSERAYPTPPCCTVKRTAQHCLREINRRVRGPDRKGPRHAEPVTGNGAKASWVVPLECRQQLLRPSPGQTVRHGARADAQSLIAAISTGTTHGVTSCAPLLPRGGETTSIPQGRAARANEGLRPLHDKHNDRAAPDT